MDWRAVFCPSPVQVNTFLLLHTVTCKQHSRHSASVISVTCLYIFRQACSLETMYPMIALCNDVMMP